MASLLKILHTATHWLDSIFTFRRCVDAAEQRTLTLHIQNGYAEKEEGKEVEKSTHSDLYSARKVRQTQLAWKESAREREKIAIENERKQKNVLCTRKCTERYYKASDNGIANQTSNS